MRRPVPQLLFLVLALAWTPAAADDPLDRVTGTEAWKAVGPQSPRDEWQEWFQARAQWRRERAELKLQRQRSYRLASMLRRSPAGPDLRQVRRVIRSRPRQQPEVASEGGGEASRDRAPEPPPWIKVPLERLDDSGQAIDEEGDRVLQDAVKSTESK